jgi:hypothetical protein
VGSVQLLWGGTLTVVIPEGWQVTRDQGQVEIVPGNGDGAVHFSVVSRGSNQVISEDVALEIAALFLKSQKTTPELTPITVATGDSECSATATLPVREYGGIAWHTDLRVAVWPYRAVVGTYVWNKADAARRSHASAILKSIFPVNATPASRNITTTKPTKTAGRRRRPRNDR